MLAPPTRNQGPVDLVRLFEELISRGDASPSSEKFVILQNEILIFSSNSKSIKILDPETMIATECPNPKNSSLLEKEKGWSACAYEGNSLILYGGISQTNPLYLPNDLPGRIARAVNLNTIPSEEQKAEKSVIELLSLTDSQEISCKQIGTYGSTSLSLTNHTANVHGRCMYIFGGRDGSDEIQNTLHVFHIENRKWVYSLPNESSSTYTPTPSARSHHSSIIVSGKLYIYGGRDDESQLLNDIWNLDLSSQFLEWKDVTPRQNLSPNTRIGASLNSFRAKILICGGENCSSITSYDIKEQQWNNYKTTEKIPWSRTSNTTTIYKDKLILATDKEFHSIALRIIK